VKASSIFSLIIFCLFLLSSFLLLRINAEVISLDLLFIGVKVSKGKLVLISFCSGLFVALLLEIIYLLLKRKTKQDN